MIKISRDLGLDLIKRIFFNQTKTTHPTSCSLFSIRLHTIFLFLFLFLSSHHTNSQPRFTRSTKSSFPGRHLPRKLRRGKIQIRIVDNYQRRKENSLMSWGNGVCRGLNNARKPGVAHWSFRHLILRAFLFVR